MVRWSLPLFTKNWVVIEVIIRVESAPDYRAPLQYETGNLPGVRRQHVVDFAEPDLAEVSLEVIAATPFRSLPRANPFQD